MRVEIWSDIACPWCFIGKRRFDEALRNLDPKIPIEIQWRSYELNPYAPAAETSTVLDFLTKSKGIPKSQAEQMMRQVTEVGATENISFDLQNAIHVNTFDSHRLVHLAQEQGKGSEMKERLFSAYFERRESLVDRQKLILIAKEIGIDETEAMNCLKSNQFEKEVREDEALGQKLGISGVPFFWIDEKYRVSGAQSAEKFMKVLNEAYLNMNQVNRGDEQGTNSACTNETCSS